MTAIAKNRGLSLFCRSASFVVFGGFLVSAAYADPIGANAGLLLRMGPDATFQEGCFPPCMCPILNQQQLFGTLKLVYVGMDQAVHAYAVEDINWHLPYANTPQRIVGTGKYSVGSPTPLTVMQQRMELDLVVGNDAVQHFDSGWVPWNPGGLDITVSINGMFCWDRVIRVQANPVPAADSRRYSLEAGSTFQRGCIDGFCDCAVGPEVPMRGEFALVPLLDNTLFQTFAVVDVRWRVVATNVVDGIPIQGVGLYWFGGEVAVQNRLSMVLSVAGAEPQTYESGMVIAGAPFPRIDVVTRTHTQCLDTVLHLVAGPAGGGEVCGGFAGIPCDAGEFCNLPPGHCCCDFQGVCTPIGEACPEYYDPVCGCDGVTYANPCFAAMAAVSIDYSGACRNGCGRPNDPPCPNAEFCKLPLGSCGGSNKGGHCTQRPNACPDVWDPVCGCNNVTYGNECDADAAGVSIAHRGACATPPCAAARVLLDPSALYCDGTARSVQIQLSPPNTAGAIALEDAPPAGWTVSWISDGGFYDATNRKVKWGPFFPPFPAVVSYDVSPSLDDAGLQCFTGTISVDGINEPVCGDDCLGSCCPLMEADLPHGGCPSCPVADCNSCDASVCGDHRIHLCEVIGYACAWMRGCHDDLGRA